MLDGEGQGSWEVEWSVPVLCWRAGDSTLRSDTQQPPPLLFVPAAPSSTAFPPAQLKLSGTISRPDRTRKRNCESTKNKSLFDEHSADRFLKHVGWR